jgi:hypothetical protein
MDENDEKMPAKASRRRLPEGIYEQHGSPFLYIRWTVNGQTYRESAKTDKVRDAKALLGKRKQEFERKRDVNRKLRFEDLMQAVLLDYENNGKRMWLGTLDGNGILGHLNKVVCGRLRGRHYRGPAAGVRQPSPEGRSQTGASHHQS